jgi:hypothetical protein
MLTFREWDYPQLFRFYGVIAALWVPCVVIGGFLSMVLMHTAAQHPAHVLPLGTRLLMGVLTGLAVIVIPGLTIGVTVRVFLNEIRWRREGDPRGR